MTARTVVAVLFAATLCAWPKPGAAEAVPQHLASMARQLYDEARSSLEDPRQTPERAAAARRTLEVLRRSGLGSWARSPVVLPDATPRMAAALGLDLAKDEDRTFLEQALALPRSGLRTAIATRLGAAPDSAQVNDALAAFDVARQPSESMATTHSLEVGRGETVELNWNPEEGTFHIRTAGDGSGGQPAYDSTLIGRAETTIDRESGATRVGVLPADTPVRVLSAGDLERLRTSILGEWRADDGDTWIFAAADGDPEAGTVRPSPEQLRAEIEALEARLEEIDTAKEYVWEDQVTKEVVRQQRFRRLGEPWEFKGERHLTPDADARMAEIRQQIETLQGQLSGAALPPVERHDPVGFEDNRRRSGARPLRVTVRQANGHSYSWDQASFDGRRVAGRRTYRVVNDINPDLPLKIKQDLIAAWSPPGWFELEATLDPVSGALSLIGNRWSLHVTYSGGGLFGDAPEVKSIHTPYPTRLSMSRPGTEFKMAFGAADSAAP